MNIENIKKIIAKDNNCHWTKGGTAITNFTIDSGRGIKVYEEAIKRFEDTNLFIVRKPFLGSPQNQPDSAALHRIGRTGDLSQFWNIFNEVAKEFKQLGEGE